MEKKQKQKNNFQKYALTSLAVLVFAFLFSYNAQASDITADNIIQLVNKERLSQGLTVLSENTVLDAAARDKAQDMIKNDYFAHTSPDGKSSWYWFEKNGYDYKFAGENLAINFTNAESQQDAWMKSATHRKNILNPSYKEIGVAVAKGKIDGTSTTLVVQLFGSQAVIVSKPAEPAPVKEIAVEKVQGEQANETIIPEKSEAVGLPEIKSEPQIKIDKLLPDSKPLVRPICENGTCYFSDRDGNILEKRMTEGIAWMVVVMVLIISIAINSITLSHHHSHNPFIAGNTVVLLMVLTSMVLWKI